MADRLDLDAIRRHAAIGGLGWTTETVDALCNEVERLRKVVDAARGMHRRSVFPASTGEHQGRHYCVGCTVSVDDFTAYVDWPCPVGGALDALDGD